MDNPTQKRIVVVLGMHRSGTSVIMKAIESLGVSIGNSLMPEAEGNNSKGFFEDLDIYNLNEKMLSTLNSSWYDLSPINNEDVAYLNSKGFLEKAVALLNEKLDTCEIFGFKEPRTTKLILFWKNVFARLNCKVDYVLALRHPGAVSMSLQKRDGIDIFRGQILWLSYQLSALSALQTESWIVQFYDLLVSDPETQLKDLARRLFLSLDAEKAKPYSERFIDPALRNFTISSNQSIGNNTEFSLPIISEIFNALYHLRDTDSASIALTINPSIKTWLDEFSRFKNQIDYINYQLSRINSLQLQILEKDSQILKISNIQNKNLNIEETNVIELCAYYGVLENDGVVYKEEFSSKNFIRFCDGVQLLKFRPNGSHDGIIGSIRFDTANVPCLAYVFELSIKLNAGDEELWKWSADSKELPWDHLSGAELVDFLPFNELTAAVVICTNDDPQMIFDISNLPLKKLNLLKIYLEAKVKLLPIKQGAEVAFNALTKARSEIIEIISKQMEQQNARFNDERRFLIEKSNDQHLVLSELSVELANTKNQLKETSIALEKKTRQIQQIKDSRIMRTALQLSKIKDLD